MIKAIDSDNRYFSLAPLRATTFAWISRDNYIGSNTDKKPWTPIYKTHTKSVVKRLRSTTFAIAKLEER